MIARVLHSCVDERKPFEEITEEMKDKMNDRVSDSTLFSDKQENRDL